MKKYIYILLILFILPVYSQQIIPRENFRNNPFSSGAVKYYKDVNHILDKFIGNWEYQNSSSNPTVVLEVTFFKVEAVERSGYLIDVLEGQYKYTVDGQEVYNSLGKAFPMLQAFGFESSDNYNTSFIRYFEPDEYMTKRKSTLHLTFAGGNPAQLNWEVSWSALDSNVPDLKIPQQLTLTKVN